MNTDIITGFHAHIYFTPDTRESAERLRFEIQVAFGPKLSYFGKLVDRCVGPHPLPMFELNFTPDILGEVMAFLILARGPHSVLIHPETGDGFKDHTSYAVWVGQPLVLDLHGFIS